MATCVPSQLQLEFFAAIDEGRILSVQLLLAAGARADVADQDGSYPIERAVAGNHVEVARVLLASGVDVNFKDWSDLLFWRDCDRTFDSLTKMLLASGINIPLSELGETCGHKLARWGNTTLLKNWLSLDARIDAQDEDGSLPIHHAAQGGHPKAIELLLGAGSDLEAADKNGNRALHASAACGRTEAVAYLLAAGACVDAENAIGHRPIHIAAKEGYLPIVKQLHAAGADLAAKTRYGKTPLALARAYGHEEVVAWLEGGMGK